MQTKVKDRQELKFRVVGFGLKLGQLYTKGDNCEKKNNILARRSKKQNKKNLSILKKFKICPIWYQSVSISYKSDSHADTRCAHTGIPVYSDLKIDVGLFDQQLSFLKVSMVRQGVANLTPKQVR